MVIYQPAKFEREDDKFVHLWKGTGDKRRLFLDCLKMFKVN